MIAYLKGLFRPITAYRYIEEGVTFSGSPPYWVRKGLWLPAMVLVWLAQCAIVMPWAIILTVFIGYPMHWYNYITARKP